MCFIDRFRLDDKFVDRWNVRCRGTTLVNALEYYHRPWAKRGGVDRGVKSEDQQVVSCSFQAAT